MSLRIVEKKNAPVGVHNTYAGREVVGFFRTNHHRGVPFILVQKIQIILPKEM
jgi:hypothetical protein